MSGAPLAAGASRRATSFERRLAEAACVGRHGPVGRQLRGRQVDDPDPDAGRLRVPAVLDRRGRPAPRLPLARGLGPDPAPRHRAARHARLHRLRRLPDALVDRPRLDERRQLGPAHRLDPGLHRARGAAPRGRPARPGQGARHRDRVRRRGRRRGRPRPHVRQRRRRRPAHARGGRLVGVLREPRGRRAAPLQRAPGDIVDRRLRSAVPCPDRTVAALQRRSRGGRVRRRARRSSYSGLLSSAVGNVVVFWGISLLGPTRITNLQFLPPALAIVFAAIFLGDPILVGQVVGGIVIVAGVLLARRSRPARPVAA